MMRFFKKNYKAILFWILSFGIIIELLINRFATTVFLVYLAFLMSLFTADYFLFKKYGQGHLDIKTPDGSNQPMHPTVLYIDDMWNGYNYIMSFTPLPKNKEPYPDRWENPTIIYSKDGFHWEYINGVVASIDDLEEKQIEQKCYYSDPHILLGADNELLCYYRLTSGDNTFVIRKSTHDGVNWSNGIIVADLSDYNDQAVFGSSIISPSVIYDDGEYLMWYVVDNGERLVDFINRKKIVLLHSLDGLVWSYYSECIFDNKDYSPWHISVIKIHDYYYLTMYDFADNITLWCSNDKISFNFLSVLLQPSNTSGSFYSNSLYRSSIVANNSSVLLYFSATSYDGKYHIGIAKIDSDYSNANVLENNRMSFDQFIRDEFYRLFYPFKALLKRIFR